MCSCFRQKNRLLGIVEKGGLRTQVSSFSAIGGLQHNKIKLSQLTKLGLTMHFDGMRTLVEVIMASKNKKFDLQTSWTIMMTDGISYFTVLFYAFYKP